MKDFGYSDPKQSMLYSVQEKMPQESETKVIKCTGGTIENFVARILGYLAYNNIEG